MLYDFHHTQNKKQPSSLHATYLVTGTQTLSPPQSEDHAPESQHGSDTTNQTTPAQQDLTSYQATSLLLVDEDNLDSQSISFSANHGHLFR
jgi:DNA polymerase delta subunit 3